MLRSRANCVLVLAIWLIAIQFLGNLAAPGLSRISYPQALDLVVLALIPFGAFHAAKYDSTRILFLLYGCLASIVFAYHFTLGQGRTGLSSAAAHHSAVGFAAVVVVGFGLLCRIAPDLRVKYENWRRCPINCCQHCGYDLTDNLSNICPECGEKI